MTELIQGAKFDTGKTRYDLVTPIGLRAVADIYTMGAAKYADHNWRKGIAWSRVFAAVMRHLWAFWCGEDNDPESGLPHVAHAAWGCLALTDYMSTRREFDDRYNKENDPIAKET